MRQEGVKSCAGGKRPFGGAQLRGSATRFLVLHGKQTIATLQELNEGSEAINQKYDDKPPQSWLLTETSRDRTTAGSLVVRNWCMVVTQGSHIDGEVIAQSITSGSVGLIWGILGVHEEMKM